MGGWGFWCFEDSSSYLLPSSFSPSIEDPYNDTDCPQQKQRHEDVGQGSVWFLPLHHVANIHDRLLVLCLLNYSIHFSSSSTSSSFTPKINLSPNLSAYLSVSVCPSLCLFKFYWPSIWNHRALCKCWFFVQVFPAQLQHAKEEEEAPIGKELLQTFFCFFCFFRMMMMMMLLLLLFFSPWNLNTLLLLLLWIFVSGEPSSSSSQAPISSFCNFRHSSDPWVVSQLQHKILRYLKSFPLMRPLLLLLLFPSTSSSTYLHVCMYLSVCLCGWVCGCVCVCFSLCLSFTSNLQSQKELKRASLSVCVPDFCPSLLLSLYLSLFLPCLFFRPHEKNEKLFGAA
jgi:hypothetical protein